MSYPEKPIKEERVEVRDEMISNRPVAMPRDPRQPQVAQMFDLIATRLSDQEKLLSILREKLAPVLAPTPKTAEEGNKVENAVVPLAEALRDIAKKLTTHNAVIDGMIEGIQI